VVLITSQGNTRILGFVAMAIVVCVEVHNYILLYRGEASGLKALYLLPFVWLHFESRKKPSHEVTTTREQPKTTYPRTPTGTLTFEWISFQPALSRPSLMLSGQ
jgi:hypothetical protein